MFLMNLIMYLAASVDTYSDEVDETQANQMIEAAIDKYY